MQTSKSIAFLFFVLLGYSTAARAGTSHCPEKPIDKESAVALAGVWFDRGIGYIDAGRDEEALNAFLCSMRMVEHADTVFNAAQAARLVGKPELALRLFQRYVYIAPYGSMSRKVQRIINELKEEVPVGEKHQEDVGPVRRAPYPPMKLSPLPKEPPRQALKIAAVTTLTTGGAALLAGTVLQILAYQAVRDGEQTKNYPKEWQDYKKRLKNLQNAAIGTWVVGGATAATGLALLVAHKMQKSPLREVELAILPNQLGFTALVRF